MGRPHVIFHRWGGEYTTSVLIFPRLPWVDPDRHRSLLLEVTATSIPIPKRAIRERGFFFFSQYRVDHWGRDDVTPERHQRSQRTGVPAPRGRLLELQQLQSLDAAASTTNSVTDSSIKPLQHCNPPIPPGSVDTTAGLKPNAKPLNQY